MSWYLVRTKEQITTKYSGKTLPFDYVHCNANCYKIKGWSSGFRSHATIFINKAQVRDWCKLHKMNIDDFILEKIPKFTSDSDLMDDMIKSIKE